MNWEQVATVINDTLSYPDARTEEKNKAYLLLRAMSKAAAITEVPMNVQIIAGKMWEDLYA